ncbi:MAG: radical SAM protein [Candidatus Omnitrophota bacterium]
MKVKREAGEFPGRVEIELSGTCNLNCTYCPRKYMGGLNGFMPLELYERLIDEMSAYPDTVVVLHRRGESLLHPRFIEMCDYIKGKFKEVQIATNATLLDDAKSRAIIDAIDFISFSIDVPEIFDKTRIPARYADVESRILRFLDMNKGRVLTQVSMVKTTETPSVNPERFKKIWTGKVNRIRIYEEHSRDGKFGSLIKKRESRMPCVMPFYELLVYFDGSVGRCNHDWNGEPMGNLNGMSIGELWSSARYEALRAQHRDLNITDEVCRGCDSWYAEVRVQGTGETVE